MRRKRFAIGMCALVFLLALGGTARAASAQTATTETSVTSDTSRTSTPPTTTPAATRGSTSGDRWLTVGALIFGLVALGSVFYFLGADRDRSMKAVLKVS